MGSAKEAAVQQSVATTATDASDMSDQVKVCPGASAIKSAHATNHLDPNSLAHQMLRVGSATDISDMSEMNCVYPDTFIPRNCPVKTVYVYESPVTSIQTHTFCPANLSSVTDCLGGINTQLGNNTLAVNCTNQQCK